jgi:hypothetical protein
VFIVAFDWITPLPDSISRYTDRNALQETAREGVKDKSLRFSPVATEEERKTVQGIIFHTCYVHIVETS